MHSLCVTVSNALHSSLSGYKSRSTGNNKLNTQGRTRPSINLCGRVWIISGKYFFSYLLHEIDNLICYTICKLSTCSSKLLLFCRWKTHLKCMSTYRETLLEFYTICIYSAHRVQPELSRFHKCGVLASSPRSSPKVLIIFMKSTVFINA